MKKLVIGFVLILLLIGYQSEDINSDSVVVANDIITVTNRADDSYSQNDLVYHDYGRGIKVSSNSRLMISKVELSIIDDSAFIYAINLENNETTQLYEYQFKQGVVFPQDISFTPNLDGIYRIVAVLSNGEIMDLTPKAIVETIYTEDDNGGFIPLR